MDKSSMIMILAMLPCNEILATVIFNDGFEHDIPSEHNISVTDFEWGSAIGVEISNGSQLNIGNGGSVINPATK
jgi:hypothetical protein